LSGVVARHAARRPDDIAVMCAGESITYRELSAEMCAPPALPGSRTRSAGISHPPSRVFACKTHFVSHRHERHAVSTRR
ncbi:hypothetical protein ACWDOP_32965, partial [Nocardia sp. NPDC003693]